MRPPSDAAGEAAAMRAFEGANDRAATPAERTLLRDLAARMQPAAEAAHPEQAASPASGWGWLEAAVWEAVEAGSAFVAPRRLREILMRWEREGFPHGHAPDRSGPPQPATAPRRRGAVDPVPPRSLPASFVIAEVGLSSRQVWAAALADLAGSGGVSRADLETWIRPAALAGREGGALIVAAPNAVARDRIRQRLLPALRQALAAAIGVPLDVAVLTEEEIMSRAEHEAAG